MDARLGNVKGRLLPVSQLYLQIFPTSFALLPFAILIHAMQRVLRSYARGRL